MHSLEINFKICYKLINFISLYNTRQNTHKTIPILTHIIKEILYKLQIAFFFLLSHWKYLQSQAD